jgi:hypothetical protein
VPRITYLKGLAELMSPWIPRGELLPEPPIELLLACMQEPDQDSAVRALRAALAAADATFSGRADPA